jgi:uncharacterized protein YecE (DUF72 family)
VTASIHIGTSGWNYKHWLGRFYPEKIRSADMLEFYLHHFDTVELNNSFYQLPSTKAFRTWRETVPKNFLFAVKGSRFITHMKKLKAPKTSTRRFFTRIEKLEDKIGPVLFQLPPHWRVNAKRLETFLERLPNQYRYAFEFREPSWFTGEVYNLLRGHNCALCIYHMSGYDSPIELTADFVYLRMHGAESTYGGSYSDSQLEMWARRIEDWRSQSKEVFVYFNNDPEGHAITDAKRLKRNVRKMIAGIGAARSIFFLRRLVFALAHARPFIDAFADVLAQVFEFVRRFFPEILEHARIKRKTVSLA